MALREWGMGSGEGIGQQLDGEEELSESGEQRDDTS